MSQSLGAGDERKARALLGGRGEADSGGAGATGGVGGFYTSPIEAFARVTSSIASGGTADGGYDYDRPGGGGTVLP